MIMVHRRLAARLGALIVLGLAVGACLFTAAHAEGAAQAAAPGATAVLQLTHAQAADICDAVQQALAGRGRVAVVPQQNALVLTGLPEALDDAKHVVQQLDTKDWRPTAPPRGPVEVTLLLVPDVQGGAAAVQTDTPESDVSLLFVPHNSGGRDDRLTAARASAKVPAGEGPADQIPGLPGRVLSAPSSSASGVLEPDGPEGTFTIDSPPDGPAFYLAHGEDGSYLKVKLTERPGFTAKLTPAEVEGVSVVKMHLVRRAYIWGQSDPDIGIPVGMPARVDTTCTASAPVLSGLTTIVTWRPPAPAGVAQDVRTVPLLGRLLGPGAHLVQPCLQIWLRLADTGSSVLPAFQGASSRGTVMLLETSREALGTTPAGAAPGAVPSLAPGPGAPAAHLDAEAGAQPAGGEAALSYEPQAMPGSQAQPNLGTDDVWVWLALYELEIGSPEWLEVVRADDPTLKLLELSKVGRIKATRRAWSLCDPTGRAGLPGVGTTGPGAGGFGWWGAASDGAPLGGYGGWTDTSTSGGGGLGGAGLGGERGVPITGRPSQRATEGVTGTVGPDGAPLPAGDAQPGRPPGLGRTGAEAVKGLTTPLRSADLSRPDSSVGPIEDHEVSVQVVRREGGVVFLAVVCSLARVVLRTQPRLDHGLYEAACRATTHLTSHVSMSVGKLCCFRGLSALRLTPNQLHPTGVAPFEGFLLLTARVVPTGTWPDEVANDADPAASTAPEEGAR